jgi:hypothetical protein
MFTETSVDFQWTTWRYIPEDGTLRNHCCEDLKSYITDVFFVSLIPFRSSDNSISKYKSFAMRETAFRDENRCESVKANYSDFYSMLQTMEKFTCKRVNNKQTNSVVLVRKRTILTERPLHVGEVSANFFLRIEGVAWPAQGIPTAIFSVLEVNIYNYQQKLRLGFFSRIKTQNNSRY